MKKRVFSFLCAALMLVTLLPVSVLAESETKVATAADMAEPVELDLEGLTPVSGDVLVDGVYEVAMDSSSSMFKTERVELRAEDGELTAVLYMTSDAYAYMFDGTAEEAATAPEEDYIPLEETEEGEKTFTLPIDALDQGVVCAAFSRRKELWYDRTLVFRADSLPLDAFQEGMIATVESLGVADGAYTAEVTLEGGSGKASVTSPARLTIEDGVCWAEIEWSSSKYDYMKVDDERYDPVNEEGNSVFVIPVAGFDFRLPVLADTTAMSVPHEIEYTLRFDSATITPAEE